MKEEMDMDLVKEEIDMAYAYLEILTRQFEDDPEIYLDLLQAKKKLIGLRIKLGIP